MEQRRNSARPTGTATGKPVSHAAVVSVCQHVLALRPSGQWGLDNGGATCRRRHGRRRHSSGSRRLFDMSASAGLAASAEVVMGGPGRARTRRVSADSRAFCRAWGSGSDRGNGPGLLALAEGRAIGLVSRTCGCGRRGGRRGSDGWTQPQPSVPGRGAPSRWPTRLVDASTAAPVPSAKCRGEAPRELCSGKLSRRPLPPPSAKCRVSSAWNATRFLTGAARWGVGEEM